MNVGKYRIPMSAHNFVLRSTSQAEEDYADILLYSVKTWGSGQAAVYRSTLYRAIESVLEFPHLGVARSDIGPHYRSFRVQHHIIYYRVLDDIVHVMRILHERQDLTGQFDDLD